ncbi:GntR family transcriptional regulator [Providencia stuartii]|uniref:GntR family transcriptional regulator n=2 Tax=Providencia TaxID=586 RepID=A0A1S1HPI2_PROST|nr:MULTISPECIES: GntR family transcriptional regulator [Providencia]MDV5224802.1 GntR family transcriptional regulator [Providencia rettgeri]QQO63958.1 GntR family transcriptional regulator [Providencia manganoxydans]ELR5041318.1 GntR family transcriptional regulator [Providencia stuartii]ELR5080824.1 GntR family transcriptional regulator [Providencia stuartii]ELR5084764.1 GntR family transcriptional regulator [Providencia stuartii]
MTKRPVAQTLAVTIAETIRYKITIGVLTPGQRLSEAALSDELDISRNTLREVFRVLTQEGLLTYAPNKGVFVSVPDMAAIIDIYQVRRLVECDSLMHAYAMHPAVQKMKHAVSEAREQEKVENWIGVGTANMKFHTAIVELSDSERLIKLYRNVAAELRLAFGHLNDPKILYAPYIDKNQFILELLDTGKNHEAAETLRQYLDLSERTLLAAYKRSQSSY